MLDGVLFFPVTPFTDAGEVDLDTARRAHRQGRRRRPRWRLHRLRHRRIPRARDRGVRPRGPHRGRGRRRPGARLRRRRRFGRPGQDLRAAPPRPPAPTACCCCRRTWSTMPQAGLVAYTRAVAAATDLPVIVYNRSNARYTEASAVEVAQIPNVVGFKDGTGDLDHGRPHRARRHRRPGTDRQAVPVLQRPAHRRDVPAGLPRDRCAAVLVGHLRVRPRARAGVLQRARARRRRAGRRAAARVLPPAGAAARHGARLRGLAGQGRRDHGRHRRRTGAAAADHAVRRDIAPAGRDHRRRPRRARRRSWRRGGAADAPSRSASPAPASPRSPSSTRRCSTPSACTSPTRCARSSSSTPTPGSSASARPTPTPRTCARLEAAADAIIGLDVFALNAIRAAIADRLGGDRPARSAPAGMITTASAVDQVFSPFEVACLDVQGHATGRPVSDLLGGTVRDAVPFSAYLFYKWAAHPGGEPDSWGEALDPDGHRRAGAAHDRRIRLHRNQTQGRRVPSRGGDGRHRGAARGVPQPSAAAGPQRRVDPADVGQGGLRAWPASSSTSRTRPPASTAWPRWPSRRRCRWPPTCASSRSTTWRPPSRKHSVNVVLSDHHYWGGLQRSRLLAGICDTFGLGLSMHSNSHLGISLAAMVHLAGATPNLTLRLRHPLAVEDRGRRQARRARVPRRRGRRTDDARAGHRDRRRRAGRAARAVPARAASATATTPDT